MLCRYFAEVAVKLPDLGEGTKEATVKEFFVKVGDEVEEVSIPGQSDQWLIAIFCNSHNYFLFCVMLKQYQDLCEVFTDKLVAKIPSTATGKVTEINFGDDEIIPVGHIILKIDETGEGEESSQEVEAATPATSVQAAQPAQNIVPT